MTEQIGGSTEEKAETTAARVAAVLEGNYVIDNMHRRMREYWLDGRLAQELEPAECGPMNKFGNFPKPYPVKQWD